MEKPISPINLDHPTITDILNYEIYCVSRNRFMTKEEQIIKIKQINELIIKENQVNNE